jgi:hypothetical protein
VKLYEDRNIPDKMTISSPVALIVSGLDGLYGIFQKTPLKPVLKMGVK